MVESVAEGQIRDFFGRVPGDYPTLAKTTMSVRFVVRRTLSRGHGSWLLRVHRGQVSASEETGTADYTIRVDDWLLGRILTGEENLIAAALRGDLAMDNGLDLGALLLLRKLLPGPPGALGPRERQPRSRPADTAADEDGAS